MHFHQRRRRLAQCAERERRRNRQRERLLQGAARKILRDDVGHVLGKTVVEDRREMGVANPAEQGGALDESVKRRVPLSQALPDSDGHLVSVRFTLGKVQRRGARLAQLGDDGVFLMRIGADRLGACASVINATSVSRKAALAASAAPSALPASASRS